MGLILLGGGLGIKYGCEGCSTYESINSGNNVTLLKGEVERNRLKTVEGIVQDYGNQLSPEQLNSLLEKNGLNVPYIVTPK